MSGPLDLDAGLRALLDHLPVVVAVGWVVRLPPFSPDEGHEAITRAACGGLDLTDAQLAALIRGVRAPDVSIRELAVFAFPFRQARHALRARYATSTADGVRALRAFVVARHHHALEASSDRRRWEGFGEVLHCLQDAYSPAHVERDGPRIVRMKHWGLLDHRHAGADGPDEHGFPSDRRDRALLDGALTDDARAAADVSRRYLVLAIGHLGVPPGPDELGQFLDDWVTGPQASA